MPRDSNKLKQEYLDHINKNKSIVSDSESEYVPVKLDEVLKEIEEPVCGEYECPTCHTGLKRTNCGRGFYCQHGIPMDDPCKKCKSEKNGSIFWSCPKCGFRKSEVPPPIPFDVAYMPRVNGVAVETLENEDHGKIKVEER